ncbi:general secretion pathway protein GspB [Ferrimonas balearica]|uniref:general secretion pathway protein GspB n=1 Tax=Ferrimonas balearica TaxID=44012 RepID=UPI001C9938ED|nr:general secretion pathway protein GspB [Ferrimonas balearica]MBY5993138.1 general secretion pathway protein GspB [Ferrimonas balearica]
MWVLIPTLLLLIAPAEAAQDPTRPPAWLAAPVAESRPAGVLQSILVEGDNRLAVIDGETFREGDPYGQSRVRSIRRDGVVLADGQILSLFPKLSERNQETRWD